MTGMLKPRRDKRKLASYEAIVFGIVMGRSRREQVFLESVRSKVGRLGVCRRFAYKRSGSEVGR